MQPISKFTNQELNAGKLLIMKQPHGLSDIDLVRLSKSADISWIKDDSGIDIDEFLCDLLTSAYEAITGNPYVSIYRVLGDRADSTLLKFTDHFGMALEFNNVEITKLYTEEVVRNTINQVRNELSTALLFHNKLITNSAKIGIDHDSFIAETASLTNLDTSYAEPEFARRIAAIKALMINKW